MAEDIKYKPVAPKKKPVAFNDEVRQRWQEHLKPSNPTPTKTTPSKRELEPPALDDGFFL